jgi:hypothetical protein
MTRLIITEDNKVSLCVSLLNEEVCERNVKYMRTNISFILNAKIVFALPIKGSHSGRQINQIELGVRNKYTIKLSR